MTERVLPLADGASACPFVAFEDDRDERATVPDHRHRCYAETQPAPRALAHQEAYCLSSAFPVCPAFQDWARREAARARGVADRAAAAAAGGGSAAVPDSDHGTDRPADAGDRDRGGQGAGLAGGLAAGLAAGLPVGRGAEAAGDLAAAADARGGEHDGAASHPAHSDDAVRRNPPRDWSAPPPWLASRDARRDEAAAAAEPPAFLGHRAVDPAQGLAGSPADRMAGGAPPSRQEPHPDEDAGWATASAAPVGRTSAGRRPTAPEPDRDDTDDEDIEDQVRRPARRPRAYAQHLGGPDGPDWERPRRYEAYPTLRSRVGMPGMPHIPRIVGLAALVAVLAVVLFNVPAFLGLGSTNTPGASPSPSSVAAPSVSIAPTVPPAPTPTLYTIKKGETLSKIAAAHGITIEELLAANPDIKDPNRISEGQQITIPVPSEAPPDQIEDSPAP